MLILRQFLGWGHGRITFGIYHTFYLYPMRKVGVRWFPSMIVLSTSINNIDFPDIRHGRHCPAFDRIRFCIPSMALDRGRIMFDICHIQYQSFPPMPMWVWMQKYIYFPVFQWGCPSTTMYNIGSGDIRHGGQKHQHSDVIMIAWYYR